MRNIKDFDRIQIEIASPEKIKEWSYGEVKKPETINYRTLRPEKDGLFCERIFGTTKEWECSCGKFKSIRYKGVVCDRCGVEVTHFKVRRERMGHIDLASPVSHIWYYRSVPSRIGLLLNMTLNDLRSVLYFEKYLVIDPGETGLEPRALISEEEYLDLKEKHGNNFEAGIGADVVKHCLASLDLNEEKETLRAQMLDKGARADSRLLKRLAIVNDFIASNNKPEWMILVRIPVIPPELRPMVQLDGGRFATSDLNDLYRRVINRNNRLKRLQELMAPEIIIRNEKRMLQEAVDALFDNSRRKRMVKGPGNRPLKSLSDMLKGKQGRFRQNLLGKRVDYSGRSVIVVGPNLKLHQCGLPKKMALELFKPFIMKKLHDKDEVFNIKSAKKLVEREDDKVWAVLEEVVAEHPILLNRAPTLHRLGIQAFEPVLVESKAIKLHPLVCHAFNADFDGDQMAVHVPLSPEAQIECWFLMLSSRNLLNPANGQPIVGPTQDIVLGICYLTKENATLRQERNVPFCDFSEVLLALEKRLVRYQEPVTVYSNNRKIVTTPGRIIFNDILPKGYPYVNKEMGKKELSNLIADIFNKYGNSTVVDALDAIKNLGFQYASRFGVTIGLDDIKIPVQKQEIIAESVRKVENIQEMYRNGLVTNAERYNMIIDEWTQANSRISEVLFRLLKEDQNGFNPVFIMADSGARGSQQQIKQLAGMRGLMAKPSGEIIEYPIKSNFKEGLNVLEYFISTHGARKGLADTALKTADAGYLTRRLVDIAQDVVISENDCGTISGMDIRSIKEGDEIIESLSERIIGRVALEDIVHPQTGQIIVDANCEVDEEAARLIEECGFESVRIRSVLTCEAAHGVCAKCYGRDLATNKTVELGEAVGIIAAQSIGQPGTQLTMRTFHIGGIAAGQIKEDNIKLGYDVVITSLPDNRISLEAGGTDYSIMPRKGDLVVQRVISMFDISKWKQVKVHDEDVIIVRDVLGSDENGSEVRASQHGTVRIQNGKLSLMGSEHSIQLKVGTSLFVEPGQVVKSGKVIARFDPYADPIISENAGKIGYEHIEVGVNVKEAIDDKTGKKQLIAFEVKSANDQPRISIQGTGEPIVYSIPGGATLTVEKGVQVKAGDVIAKIPRELTKTKDITGGLPRVAELFEARKPRDSAILTEVDGIISFEGTNKGKRMVRVTNDAETKDYLVPLSRHIIVRDGDFVKSGEQLCDGPIDPHDILHIKGEHELMRYLLNEIQEVYRLQGVKINDKHIGVIIRQMLRKVEVTEVGDTDLIIGQQINRVYFGRRNEETVLRGGQPASAKPILLGLTKASISIESFISAASFQETTKVLTNAAIRGKVDRLHGLKENVIIGHKIPAGTGLPHYRAVDVILPPEYLQELEILAAEKARQAQAQQAAADTELQQEFVEDSPSRLAAGGFTIQGPDGGLEGAEDVDE